MPEGFGVAAHAHQADAQLRARREKLGVQFDGLAIELDGLLIAPVEHEEMADGRVAPGRMRVEGGLGLARKQVHGSQDGFGADRVGVHGQGLLGFIGGASVVVVFEREARQQFLRLQHVRIEIQRAARQRGSVPAELVRGQQRLAQDCAGIVLVDGERFVEQLGGILGVAVLEVHAAPADLAGGVLRVLAVAKYFETLVGFQHAVLPPERFRLLQGLSGKQGGEKKEQGARAPLHYYPSDSLRAARRI